MKKGGLIRAAGRMRPKKKKTKQNLAAPKTHRPQHAFFRIWKLPLDLRAAINTKCDMSDMAIVQPTEQPRTSRREEGSQKTCLDIPLTYVCRSALLREQWRLVVDNVLSCSRSLK